MAALRTTACTLVCVMSLSACSGSNGGFGGFGSGSSGETIGTLGGAAAGGLIGSQFGSGTGNVVATAAGVVLGGLAGREIGRRITDKDRDRAAQAERDAVAREREVSWSNPESGNRGRVEPARRYTDSRGRECRDYVHYVEAGDQRDDSRLTACRNSDGSWQVVN